MYFTVVVYFWDPKRLLSRRWGSYNIGPSKVKRLWWWLYNQNWEVDQQQKPSKMNVASCWRGVCKFLWHVDGVMEQIWHSETNMNDQQGLNRHRWLGVGSWISPSLAKITHDWMGNSLHRRLKTQSWKTYWCLRVSMGVQDFIYRRGISMFKLVQVLWTGIYINNYVYLNIYIYINICIDR